MSGATPGRGFEVQPVTDKTTMSVRPDQKDAIEELTTEHEPLYVGVDRLLEAYDDANAPGSDDSEPDRETAIKEVRELLERIESSAQTAEERTGAIERKLEGLQQ